MIFKKKKKDEYNEWSGVPLGKRIWKHRVAYMFLIAAIVYTVVFNYSTMYGITLAFKTYRYDKGIIGSPWAGMKYFRLFLHQPGFFKIVLNTFKYSLSSLIFGYPGPIIFALLLNEMNQLRTKRVVQTISYLPHFVSWVVVIALFKNLLSPYNGLVNEILGKLFHTEPYYFFGEPKAFLPMYLLIGMWKDVGWNSILYLATLSGVDMQLYEAARIDGAGRFKQAIHISLPALMPVIGLQLIMKMGSLTNVSFETVFLMQTPATIDTSEVLSTYLVKSGLQNGQYSVSTAVGLCQCLVSLSLMSIANHLSKKYTEISMW